MGRNKSRGKKFSTAFIGAIPYWFGWWLACAHCQRGRAPVPVRKALCAGLAMGATSHVLLDMLTTQGSAASALHARKNRVSLSLFHRQNGENTFFWPPLSRSAPGFMGEDSGCRGNEYCQRLEPGALAQN